MRLLPPQFVKLIGPPVEFAGFVSVNPSRVAAAVTVTFPCTIDSPVPRDGSAPVTPANAPFTVTTLLIVTSPG